MVKKRFHLVVIAFALLFSLTAISTAIAQERVYHIGHEWVTVSINQDGTIDLFYDMSLTLDSGQNINYVLIGQPQGDFTVGEAVDQYGRSLTTSDASSGGDYKVRVDLYEPLRAGQTVRFNLTDRKAHV